ncbi:MAG: ABC transporter ATP-binding protein [Chloroflexi bacterium]|nr:MAG: ABC transporter ATP-binding protein [Actinobacteria bacterium 13_2_20CM_2_66_6]TMF75239.1 MAG: ABC transporter ATP-binding protein [Chloroflexota bacterium]TMF76290.1 MAG: ABC transporter ATP-binding protein [Chloroflexota bacterium]TMF93426.1 MAG: ABC transporter ATP-binding protein [Chloroflexota bacterium]TMG44518.1 MAG: ABC transporter ATP-binding protein [Chloroflexota bacterium]
MALLELNDVVAGYGPTTVLHGVSLSVDEGGIVALLGANGAGKTTTLRAISSTVRRTGRVVFDGHDISSHAPENVARLGIAHVPEGRGTLGQLTVWENLQMGAYIRRGGVAKADYDRVCEYFAWIPERRRQVAATLSGGEQQMLAIARALMMRPRMLLLDEPSLGLAPLIVQEIFKIVRAINEQDKVTVLVVEQNASIALQASAHAYVLEVGRVVVSGTSVELQKDEAVRRSYLGY